MVIFHGELLNNQRVASGVVNIARENGRIKMRQMYGFYFIPNVL